MACLDTDVLIDLSGRGGRRRQDASRRKLIELERSGEPLTTTRFNVAELWVGIARSRSPQDEEQAVDRLLEGLIILEFDDSCARMFGSIVASLQQRGRPIGDMDALIASVAMCYGQRMLTRNLRHFAEIPNLMIEPY